jgi:fatty acid desaturase
MNLDAMEGARTGIEALADLTQEQLRKLSTLNPLRSVLQIAAEWLAIAGAIYLSTHHWNPLLYVLMVALIGARQHALLILMHEGAHYRLCRSRRLNDGVSELILAWPFFVTMRAYRSNHTAHHRHMNTDRDPDWNRKVDQPQWAFPKHWAELVWLLFGDLSGLNAIELMRLARSIAAQGSKPPRWFVLSRLGFYLAAAALIIATGGGPIFMLYWLIPYFTWLAMVLHLRSIAEHFSIPDGKGAHAGVRTTRLTLLERLMLAPNNINYHAEHHRFPSVPFYRLPELHRLLISAPEFRRSAHLSDGYFAVLRECCRSAAESGALAEADPRPALGASSGVQVPLLAEG